MQAMAEHMLHAFNYRLQPATTQYIVAAAIEQAGMDIAAAVEREEGVSAPAATEFEIPSDAASSSSSVDPSPIGSLPPTPAEAQLSARSVLQFASFILEAHLHPRGTPMDFGSETNDNNAAQSVATMPNLPPPV